MPKYARDTRLQRMKEVEKPPENLFAGLGWDDDGADDSYKEKEDAKGTFCHIVERKHYRSIYPDELENNKEIFPQ